MRIKEADSARIVELLTQIRERQARDEEYTNYKDAPALHEMADLIRPYIAQREQADEETLADIDAVCSFLGCRYRELLRGVYAAEFFTAAFFAYAAGAACVPADAEERFRDAVQTRNWYVDDPCEDLKRLAVNVMDAATVETAFAEASGRTLKRDPVEMTPAYLAVIDEVEQKVQENMTFHGRGSCHERWALTRELLEAKGVRWRSPNAMNPGWRFD